jgi:SAM-dependent methyltransferase
MRAASGHITVTPLVLKDFKLPFEDGAIDLIVDAMSTQGLDESAKKAVFKEFRRVARGGALVLSLSNEEPDWTRAMVWEGEPSTWRVRDIDQAGDLYCLTAGCLL